MVNFKQLLSLNTDLKAPSMIPTITVGSNRKTKLSRIDGVTAVVSKQLSNPTELGKSIYDLDDSKTYDFREFLQAEDVDGYISTTFRLTVEQCTKEGFEFVGPNTDLVDSIEVKIKQILHMSSTNLTEFIENMVTGLTKFSNAMAVFTRATPEPGSKFKRYKHKGKILNPISGIFYVEPQHMTPRRKKGNITKWTYENSNTVANTKEFRAYNVLHSKWNRKGDHSFGTPWILPALDDIRMLRRLEEFVQMLISKHLFPLIQYKVGTDKAPAQRYGNDAGTYSSEVAQVRSEVGDLPTQGVVFTSNRHEIKAIDQRASVLDINEYIQHFDRRALTSCGLSDIDVGRGGSNSKSTALILNQTRVDRCTRIQGILQADLYEQLILPLLLAMGKNPFDPANAVNLVFNPINTEERRAKDIHATNLFNSNAITHDEYRKSIGKRAFTTKEEWDNIKQNTIDRIRLTQESALQKANSSNSNDPAANTASNVGSPANQNGKKVKPKVSANS